MKEKIEQLVAQMIDVERSLETLRATAYAMSHEDRDDLRFLFIASMALETRCEIEIARDSLTI